MIRKLTEHEVTFRIEAEFEELPVRGYFASGDDTADRADEDAILARVAQDDVWAWASVRVTASWNGYQGSDTLGACSYADEDEFTQPGDYYDDMKQCALDELNELLERAESILSALRCDSNDQAVGVSSGQ